MRDTFGVPYQTALRLLREHGVEKATELLEEAQKRNTAKDVERSLTNAYAQRRGATTTDGAS
jgi:hypothetical protein